MKNIIIIFTGLCMIFVLMGGCNAAVATPDPFSPIELSKMELKELQNMADDWTQMFESGQYDLMYDLCFNTDKVEESGAFKISKADFVRWQEERTKYFHYTNMTASFDKAEASSDQSDYESTGYSKRAIFNLNYDVEQSSSFDAYADPLPMFDKDSTDIWLNSLVICYDGTEWGIRIHVPQYINDFSDYIAQYQEHDISPENLENTYIPLNYKLIDKNPDSHKNEKYKISGRIVQIMEDASSTDIRLDVNDVYGDTVYIYYDGLTEYVEDDYITVYGVCEGKYTYTSSAGFQITLPLFRAIIID